MAEILNPGQLRRLTEHKYSAENCSILDCYMQVFWNWLVNQVPLWWAPNAITLTGLIINIVTTCIILFYCPDASTEIPPWASILCAVGLFIYQSLDAIDGKQARRTKTASPLGELFDHGCDALSTVFVILGVSCAMNLGDYPLQLLIQCVTAFFMFYVAHWQTYVSGTMKFSRFDVTEAQFAAMSIYIITSLFGSSFWNMTIPIVGMPAKLFCALSSVIGAFAFLATNFNEIFLKGGVGKNGSTIAGTSVISPIFPIGALIILCVVICCKSSSNLLGNYPCLYIMSFGLAIAKVTTKLVIAHMTKSEMDFFDSAFVGPALLFFNQYFDILISEIYVLWMCFFWCCFDFLSFANKVCLEICEYLNICCFVIPSENDIKSSKEIDQSQGVALKPIIINQENSNQIVSADKNE